MTLAEAIRESKRTGCEFWLYYPYRYKFRRTEDGPVMMRWDLDDVRWHYAATGHGWSTSEVLSHDWQIEETAPHGEGAQKP